MEASGMASEAEYENRRLRLQELLDLCGGKRVELAKRIDKDPTYVSRLLSAPSASGHKNVSDEIIRAAREAFSLPAGWFDLPSGTAPPSIRPASSPAIVENKTGGPTPRRESLNTQLEELLLDTFRRFDSDADRLAALNAMNDLLSNRLGRRGAHDPFGKPSPAQKHPVRGMSQFGELDEPPAKTKSGGGRR